MSKYAELIQEASKALEIELGTATEVEQYQQEIIRGLLGMSAAVLADASKALAAHEQAGYDKAMREVAAEAETRRQVGQLLISGQVTR